MHLILIVLSCSYFYQLLPCSFSERLPYILHSAEMPFSSVSQYPSERSPRLSLGKKAFINMDETSVLKVTPSSGDGAALRMLAEQDQEYLICENTNVATRYVMTDALLAYSLRWPSFLESALAVIHWH
jgi:hypothetical protein